MKEIKAYLRPHQLDEVVDALEADPESPGVTVTEVKGYGHPKGGGPAEFTRRVKLETVVPEAWVDRVVETIIEKARTGRFGDGKIFVSSVNRAIRIRTGEKGDEALTHPQDQG